MATGALGGVPVTTTRNFAYTGALSNFAFYTCPTNTICYVNLQSAASSGTGQLTEIGVRVHNGFQYVYHNMAVNMPGSYGASGINLMGETVAFQAQLGATLLRSGLLGRIDNPFVTIASGLTNMVCGQIILYPGDSLYLTGGGFGSPENITFETLEVVAGS